MKAVILAAGEGSRMQPLTENRPKSMLPVGNVPILEHIVRELAEADIQDIIIIVGYAGENIRNHFGDGRRWNVNIEYSEERHRSGTAHAIGLVRNIVNEPFLAMNGDILVRSEDIQQIMLLEQPAMAVYEVEDARRFGCVEIKGDRIVDIHEKNPEPPTNMVNAGIYILTEDVFGIIDKLKPSPRGEYEITDCLKILAQRREGLGYYRLSVWQDISYPWDLLTANEAVLSGLQTCNFGRIETGVQIQGPVQIGENTVVQAGSYIEGPVVIGAGCHIGPSCFIRPFTAIGNNCHIGAFTEIKNSIIMSGTNVPHQNYVGDSIIGEKCNLGAGTRIANLRFDNKSITINGIDTGRRKFGAVFGDNVLTGINVTVNAGTMIGGNSCVGPGAVIKGTIKPGTIIE